MTTDRITAEELAAASALPTAADLDAHEAQQGKTGHDAVMEHLTAAPQEPASTVTLEQVGEAVEYVKSKGYTAVAATEIVSREGAVEILKSKAHEATLTANSEGLAAAGNTQTPAPNVIDRYGTTFEPERHAAHPSGEPKYDSTGKFILKQHDYAPRTPNIPGGK